MIFLLIPIINRIYTVQAMTTEKNMQKNMIQFSNKVKIKTLFYPYRDALHGTQFLQGITADNKDNYYVTYAIGDQNRYGYIYKYNKNGELLKKSKKLTIGHGQAITFKSGYLYQIADIKGKSNYTLQKINTNTLKVVRKWLIPPMIHPNVIAMIDDQTAVGASKSGDGYDINKIHLGEGKEATRDWKEKFHISGLIGRTPGKEVQGFAFGNGEYFLLSNGEYMTFNPDGSNVKRILLNTNREPEGIAIANNGKIIIAFNKINEIFIQK